MPKAKFNRRLRDAAQDDMSNLMEQLRIGTWAMTLRDDPSSDDNIASILAEVEQGVQRLRERMRHIRHAEAGEPTP